MKVYISGKITGLPLEEAREKFAGDEEFLMSLGYDVVNPMNVTSPDNTWHGCMIDCIRQLFCCKAIYMQPDWGQSRGARIEYNIAQEIGLNIIYGSKVNYPQYPLIN